MMENNMKRIGMFYILYMENNLNRIYIHKTESLCYTVELTQHYKSINFNFLKYTYRIKNSSYFFLKKDCPIFITKWARNQTGISPKQIFKWFNIIARKGNKCKGQWDTTTMECSAEKWACRQRKCSWGCRKFRALVYDAGMEIHLANQENSLRLPSRIK